MDYNALIAKYKGDEEEITKTNESIVAVKEKQVLLSYTEAIPLFLWQLHKYFLNSQPNGKRLFSKVRLTHNIDI